MSDLIVNPAPGQDVVVVAPTGTKLGSKVSYNSDHTRVRVKNTGTPPVVTPPPPTPTTTVDGTGKVVPLQQGLVTATTDLAHYLITHASPGGGLELGASGITISDTEIAHCVQQGWHGSGRNNVTLRRVRNHHHNLRSEWPGLVTANPADSDPWLPKGLFVVDPFWEAGGSKITHCTGTIVEDSLVYANGGPGIWFDISGNDVTIRRNKVWGNLLSGIMFEISRGALIEDNLVWGNALQDSIRKWGWWSNVLISSSLDVTVRRNVIADGPVGLAVISQNRNEGSYTGISSGIVIDGNTFLGVGTRVGFYDDHGGSLFTQPSNRIVNNLFDPAEPKPVEWNGVRMTMAQIQAHPSMGPSNRWATAAEVAAARALLVAA